MMYSMGTGMRRLSRSMQYIVGRRYSLHTLSGAVSCEAIFHRLDTEVTERCYQPQRGRITNTFHCTQRFDWSCSPRWYSSTEGGNSSKKQENGAGTIDVIVLDDEATLAADYDAFDDDDDEYLFDDPGSPKWSGDPFDSPSDQYVPSGEPKDYDNLEPWNVQDDTEGLGALADLYKRPEVKRIKSMKEILDHENVTMYLASDATENNQDIEELNESDWPITDIVTLLLEEQADDLLVLRPDPADRAQYAEWIFIASGRSGRHLHAMGTRVKKEIKARGLSTPNNQGSFQKGFEFWMLVKVGGVVVHLFQPEARVYYNLEGLWAPKGCPLWEPYDGDDFL